ncbi:MAG: Spy/CpxP family protein refolding chaperone [Saprospiraceae bacterium]|nr:Spy/CpxP family protein refolding chaperone [Saprospiraceae bacterium]
MDIFTQKKTLVRTVAALAIMNVVTLSVLLWREFAPKDTTPRTKDGRDVSAILKQELQLTDEQVAHIQTLRDNFFKQEKILANTIRSKRDSMNLEMFNKNTDENRVKALAAAVADNEYAMELLRFEQSKSFKAICTPEQLEKFGDLVKEIKQYFKPEKKTPK